MKHTKKTPAANSFAALHSRCMNSGNSCQGPGCTITRNRYSTAAPRVRTTPTKAEKRLQARITGFEKGGTPEHRQMMHKPGSQNK